MKPGDSSRDNAVPDGLAKAVRNAVEAHGHSLQYAVARAAEEADKSGKSHWTFEVAEFPVRANEHEGRIDLVYKYKGRELFLAIECKRVNPRYSRWVFFRSPAIRRDSGSESLILDHLNIDARNVVTCRGRAGPSLLTEAYHLGTVVKVKDQPDSEDDGWKKKDIEDVAHQACLGAAGLCHHWWDVHDQGDRSQARDRWVLPVVVTTAEMFGSNLDLGSANLLDGSIDEDALGLAPLDWLVLQHHSSPSLKRRGQLAECPGYLSPTVAEQFVRSIPIVSSRHLTTFLRNFNADLLLPVRPVEGRFTLS